MSVTPEEAWLVYQEADCLYTSEQVENAIKRMADAITDRLAEKNPLLLCVMSGALIPMGNLLTHLNFPLQIDYIHATRYGNEIAGSELKWISQPHGVLNRRVVLIVDDILDEGLTLDAIVRECKKIGASEVYSAVLVEKEHERNIGIRADFVGLQVEDRYVFGYGMDYKGYLRNVPGIYAVKSS
jgi:hypoxanthine phosphoribosyltransferase